MVIDVYDKNIVWEDADEQGEGTIIADNFDGNKLGSVTIKNYTAGDVMTSMGDLTLATDSSERNIKGYFNTVYMDSNHYNKASYVGSWVEDNVIADNYKMYKDKNKTQEITTETVGYEKIKGVTINLGGTPTWDSYFGIEYGTNYAKGSIYADTITGGIGNDVITGGKGNDILAGGGGENIINVTATEAFGDDVVTLTRGEKLTIKVADLNEEDSHWDYCYSHIVGKDLVVEVYNGVINWEDDEYECEQPTNLDQLTKMGSVTIRNFATTDVIGGTGELLLTDNNESSISRDLRHFWNETIMDSEHYNKASFVGTWLSDEVYANNYKMYKDKNKTIEITTETEGYEKVKGVNINLGAAPADVYEGEMGTYTNYGWNNAVGSIYADTITGGIGDDDLEGGKGNDILTGGKGRNEVWHSSGDGADTYNMTSGEDLEIFFEDLTFGNEDIHYSYANGTKDLKMYYTDNQGNEAGSVTIKNFVSRNITNSAFVFDSEYDYEDLTQVMVVTNTNKNFTGTWMNDEIYATTATKGVTINAGNGNNFVIGSDFADALIGGAGMDYLQGGKGNDKLTGGKGQDAFLFDSEIANGVDIITDASEEDFIGIGNFEGEIPFNLNNLRYLKNGNNLEVYYNDEYDQNNKIIVQNHFKKDGSRVATSLVTTDYNPHNLAEVAYGYTGAGAITADANDNVIIGSIKADTIKGLAGNDTISAGAGNDNIYGGIGNDTINAGIGANNIYYSLGDGNDTIQYGGGTDTLVFDKGIIVTAEYSGDNAVITYSGVKNNEEYSNAITIEDFKNNQSVKYVKIGTAKAKAIETYFNGGGETTTYHIAGTDFDRNINLAVGNNTVVFDDCPQLGYANTLISANKAGNGSTDTIDLSKKDNQGKGISFMDNTLLIYGSDEGEGYTDDLWLDATAFPDCPGEGEVFYKDFYKSTSANVVVKDKDRSYNAKGYNTVQNLALVNDDTNRLIAIKADEGTSSVVSNANYNVIKTFGGAALNYTYNGGHDNVTALEFDTNDTYSVNLTKNTSVNIIDFGGEADTLTVTGTELSDLRLLFNVRQNEWTQQWVCDSDSVLLLHKDNASKDTLSVAVQGNAILTDGINIKGEMETVTVNGSEVSVDSWCNQIKNNVVGWLTNDAHSYDSVADALTECQDQEALSQLVAYYTGYSA